MKKIISVVAAFLVIASANFLLADDVRIKAKVLYCHDGDTCRIKANEALWLNVRLAGIDAPEVGKKNTGQPLGDTARDYLNKKLQDKDVEVKQTDLDPYNRPVVEIYLENVLVNLTLVEDGYAEAYRGKAKRLDKAKYITAEESAKKNKLGIWATENYVSPSTFRKQKKSH